MWALAACSDPPPAGPVELSFSGDAPAADYLVTYEQDITWGSARLERLYGARYSLRGVGSDGVAARLSGRLDSLGITQVTPHGRATQDTRYLNGIEFVLSVPGGGGGPTYPVETPIHEMPGQLEGRLSLARLMDFGFPALPAGPVSVGASWTATASRPYVAANVHATADLTTEYVLTRLETVDGVRAARVEGRMTGTVSAPASDLRGRSVSFDGTIGGDLTWLLDAEGGLLLEMTGETRSEGTLSADGNTAPISQLTRIRIER